jgi:hypothetical protein
MISKGAQVGLVTVQLLAFMQSACVSSRLAPTVVSYNLAVEQAQNEMLLLNAVRAAKKQPLYLTDISKITGSIKRDLTASLTLPFGYLHGGIGANNTASPGTTYSVNPTFDISILDTQDFMRGFLRPVDPEVFAYYWNQGWPKDLLLHLFVQQVEIIGSAPADKTILYDNHPRSEPKGGNEDLMCFNEWVSAFLAATPHFISTDTEHSRFGPTLSDTKIQGFSDAIAAEKQGLRLELVPSKAASTSTSDTAQQFQLKIIKKEYKLQVGPRELALHCPGLQFETRDEINEPVASHLHILGFTRATIGQADAPKTKEEVKEIVLKLRSPEGIIYYLGQIIRMERNNRLVPRVAVELQKDRYGLVPLFVAFPTSGGDEKITGFPPCRKNSVKITDAEGERYIIPREPWKIPSKDQPGLSSLSDLKLDDYIQPIDGCDSGESMHVMSILTQLISLQKVAQDFPTTSTVRTVGGQ